MGLSDSSHWSPLVRSSTGTSGSSSTSLHCCWSFLGPFPVGGSTLVCPSGRLYQNELPQIENSSHLITNTNISSNYLLFNLPFPNLNCWGSGPGPQELPGWIQKFCGTTPSLHPSKRTEWLGSRGLRIIKQQSSILSSEVAIRAHALISPRSKCRC